MEDYKKSHGPEMGRVTGDFISGPEMGRVTVDFISSPEGIPARGGLLWRGISL
jgi:hypothetical protein